MWLKRIGIETRARTLAAAVAEDKRPRIAADLTRLVGTGPTDMGSLFKAMAISRRRSRICPAFAHNGFQEARTQRMRESLA